MVLTCILCYRIHLEENIVFLISLVKYLLVDIDLLDEMITNRTNIAQSTPKMFGSGLLLGWGEVCWVRWYCIRTKKFH